MRKFFYLSFMCLVMSLAVPATAQISSITDLYGKYKFTATVEVVDATYNDTFANSSECDVTVTSESGYMAGITGFAGSSQTILVNKWNAETQGLTVLNPNYPQIFSGLDMTWYEGTYPYVWNDSILKPYNEIVYTYDAAAKTISVPDFSIVKCNHGESSADIVARFTDVKMTLVEAEVFEVIDLSGEWTYEPYYVRNDSTFATTFNITLTKTDTENKAYDATFTIGDFAPFTLQGTFDGMTLSIPYDTLYLSLEDSIRFGSWTTMSGSFDFNLASSSRMDQNGYWIVTRDTIYTWDEAGDSLAVNPAERLQYYYSGGKITRENPDAFDWLGTYKVTIPAGGMMSFSEEYTFPDEFEIVFEEKYDYIYMTWFMGEDIYTTCNSTILLNGAEDGSSAELDLSASYYGPLVKNLGNGAFLRLNDINGEATQLTLTRNDDGTYTMSDFWISKYTYGESEQEWLCGFSGATLEKTVPEPFNWLGEFVATAATVEGEGYPTEFDFVIEDIDGVYMLTTLMGNDLAGLNWGGLKLTVSEDGNSASLALNGGYGAALVKSNGDGTFLQLADAEGSTAPLTLTVEGDAIHIDGFKLMTYSFNDNGTIAELAHYSDITAVRKVADDAVDYTPNHTGEKTRAERLLNGVTMVSSYTWETNTLTVDNTTPMAYSEYVDSVSMIAAPGDVVTMTVDATGSWMNAFVYIDTDADGFTASIAEGSEWQPAGDLVSYSFYNNGNTDSDATGWNSVGEVVTGDNRSTIALPAFAVPAAEGTYRVRVKYDWCNIDPAGSTESYWNGTFMSHGAQIVDFLLKVEAVPTGIDSVTDASSVEGIYDLLGRRIDVISAPGIYIVNGKKTLVK